MGDRMTARCPVCDMVGEPDLTTRYHEIVFHFCSEQCRDTFVSQPWLYTGRAAEREPQPRYRLLRLARANLARGGRACCNRASPGA